MWVFLARIGVCQSAIDFTQAEAMLNLLRSCHANQAQPIDLDRVLSLPGTALVVAQQNISRRITMQQYRNVLVSACAGKIADVKPAEPGARAAKGVAGLIEDVAPSLLWGRDNVPLLDSLLSDLRHNQDIGNAIPLARKYLPEPVPLAPRLYVVMGGRAGAATIEDQLYFDVLISQWRASRESRPPLSPAEVVEFFAHETHHLGYAQMLEHVRDLLHLSPAEKRVWDFLAATLMEGSATFLINGHEKLSDLEKQPDISVYLHKAPELLRAMQDLLRSALKGPMSEEGYDEATGPFLNMGYHATGAVLLAAIEKKEGIAGVMEVMKDPRRLLVTYNDCAAESTVNFKFESTLAQQTVSIGSKR